MNRYKRMRSSFVLNNVLAVAAASALAGPPAWAQNTPSQTGKSLTDKPAAQDKQVDKADKTDKPIQTGSKDAVDPNIDPVAIWDGRGLVPFHSIDNPKMVTAAQVDFLNDDEYVLGLTVNGEARAYPTRFVWWHHFVNDKTDKSGPEFPELLDFLLQRVQHGHSLRSTRTWQSRPF